jgi:hypothetical protein
MLCEDAPCCGCCDPRDALYDAQYEQEQAAHCHGLRDEDDHDDFYDDGEDEGEDDGQPSDLQEHEDFEQADEYFGFYGSEDY